MIGKTHIYNSVSVSFISFCYSVLILAWIFFFNHWCALRYNRVKPCFGLYVTLVCFSYLVKIIEAGMNTWINSFINSFIFGTTWSLSRSHGPSLRCESWVGVNTHSFYSVCLWTKSITSKQLYKSLVWTLIQFSTETRVFWVEASFCRYKLWNWTEIYSI